jgi:glucose/mannose transport system substrate-binding protein
VQVPFSRAKGSVPVLRTVDVSTLSPYQQNSSKSLWSAPVLLSVAHGESMSQEFQEGFYDGVSAYVRTRDPDAFATELEEAVSAGRVPPR